MTRQKVAIVPKKIDELAGHLLTKLGGFQYRLSGYDRVWDIVFTDLDGKPQGVKVVLYQETHYLFHIDGTSCNLEITPEGVLLPSEDL